MENTYEAIRTYMPKGHHNKLIKAIMQYGLISDGDRVLVGFSGGKDSAFLLHALKSYQSYSPARFELGAVAVDLGFDRAMDEANMKSFTDKLGIPLEFVRTKAYKVIRDRSEESPCAWCSYFRRACVNSYAKDHGYNKVAYAHHMDDAIETLLMNMLYSGRGGTFLPKTELSRVGVYVIRPLLYFSEREIVRSLKFLDFTPVDSPCPYSCDTARARIKGLIQSLDVENRMVRRNLESVVRIELLRNVVSEGPEKSRKILTSATSEEQLRVNIRKIISNL